MKRRAFLQTSVAALSAAAATAARGADPSAPGEFYELRTYTLKAAKYAILDGYLAKALLPALKRYGIRPVGVFTEKMTEDPTRLYVLIGYTSSGQFGELSARL